MPLKLIKSLIDFQSAFVPLTRHGALIACTILLLLPVLCLALLAALPPLLCRHAWSIKCAFVFSHRATLYFILILL